MDVHLIASVPVNRQRKKQWILSMDSNMEMEISSFLVLMITLPLLSFRCLPRACIHCGTIGPIVGSLEGSKRKDWWKFDRIERWGRIDKRGNKETCIRLPLR
ncbi:hypothetical protein LguiA_007149 [Lonicera macranthoides]